MTVKEFRESKKYDCSSFTTRWAEDTKGGFGKKGWTAYGDVDSCEIVYIIKTQFVTGVNYELHIKQ